MCRETAECFCHPRVSKRESVRGSHGAEGAGKRTRMGVFPENVAVMEATRVEFPRAQKRRGFGGQPGVSAAARRTKSHLCKARGSDRWTSFRSKCRMTLRHPLSKIKSLRHSERIGRTCRPLVTDAECQVSWV